jgi:DNA-binding transcriptional LysR family regulator
MRFDFVDLRLFLHVAEAASITHGAARSHLALASASARIRGMEVTLGVPLLERQRRGVRLTPAGHALAHHARAVLQQLERMRGELGDYARGFKAHIRLLSNTAGLSEFLPDVLAAFLTAHPNIDVDLEERPSYQIVAAVAEGVADIGIVADTVDLGQLETFRFREDTLVLVVPKAHGLARRREISLRETLGEEFIGLGGRSALQDHLGQHAIRAGAPFKLRVRVGSFDAICQMVARGAGLGIVSVTAAKRCRRSMPIRLVPLTDPWAVRQLMICIRRFAELPAHARRLVEHLATPQVQRRAGRKATAR